MICKVLRGLAVILDKQCRTLGDLGVVIHEVHHLLHVNGGKVLTVQAVHELTEIMHADLTWVGYCSFRNGMEHDGDHNGARHGVGRSPLGFEVLAGIIDIRVGRIQRIKGGGCKLGGQRRRSLQDSRRWEWCLGGGCGDFRSLNGCKRGLHGLGHGRIWINGRRLGLARIQQNGEQADGQKYKAEREG